MADVLSGLCLGAPEADDAGASTRAVGEKAAENGGGGFPLWAVVLLVVVVILVAVAVGVVLWFRNKRKREAATRRVPRRRRQGFRAHRPSGSQGMSHTQAPAFHTIPVANVEDGSSGANIGKLHGQGARPQQQDSFGVSDTGVENPEGQLLVVCDGMGGLANGGEVSETAVATILDHFLDLPLEANPIHALLSLAVDANKAVNNLLGPEGIKKSGSTLVMALIRGGYLSFLSIGDSRICLLRNGELMQLNREHDYVKELAIRAINGEMLLYDALIDPQGKALMSYLGMGEIRDVDYPSQLMKLHPNDVVILMSDGVYNALTDEEICEALKGSSPEEAAGKLGSTIEGKAFENQDNYTAVIVSYDGF